jgi:hypothetical protein
MTINSNEAIKIGLFLKQNGWYKYIKTEKGTLWRHHFSNLYITSLDGRFSINKHKIFPYYKQSVTTFNSFYTKYVEGIRSELKIIYGVNESFYHCTECGIIIDDSIPISPFFKKKKDCLNYINIHESISSNSILIPNIYSVYDRYDENAPGVFLMDQIKNEYLDKLNDDIKQPFYQNLMK